MSPKNQKPDPLNAVDQEWQEEDMKMFSFAVNQVAIPTLTIAQPSSRMPGRAKHEGQIYNTVTHEFFKSVELAFVGWNTPRAVLPYPFNSNAKQLCASPDSLRPYVKYVGREIKAANNYDEMTITVPETCDECPLSENGLCTQMFRYFGLQALDNGELMPFSMRLKRTAMEAARQLNFWLNRMENSKQYTTYIMSTEERPSDSGVYYVPVFEIGQDAKGLYADAVRLNKALEERVKREAQAQLTQVDNEE